MKHTLGKWSVIISGIAASSSAFAHTGGQTLACSSIGTGSPVHLELRRGNTSGFSKPDFTVTVGGKKFEFEPEDLSQDFGETSIDHHAGTILITFDDVGSGEPTQARVSVKAVSKTVKVTDGNSDKPLQWPVPRPPKGEQEDDCAMVNFTATFEATVDGNLWMSEEEGSHIARTPLKDIQMKCTFSTQPGMNC